MPEAFPECNPTRTAPVRALNAIYQNTTAKSMLVIVSVSCSPTGVATAFVQAQIDPTSPPATVVAEAGAPAGVIMTLYDCVSFLVPSGWFYSVANVAGAVLLYWEEIQF